MAVQMPHDMPSMPPDRRTAHHSHMFVRRPALVTFRSAPFRTGKYPPRSCAMRDGPWPVSPWRRQISLHGTPISGHLYRGAPCPGMGKEESGKSKSPRQANRENRETRKQTCIEELRPRISPDKTSSTALPVNQPSSSSLSSFCFSSSRVGLSYPSSRYYTSDHAHFFLPMTSS